MDKIALVFSGQGSQYPGMGKAFYERFKCSKEVFDMADSQRPGTLRQCFEGTAEELSVTANTQPCLFAADLAAARAVSEYGVSPCCVSGFSLGELPALAFAGALSDEDAFKLVCRRGELMDKASKENPGAMLAVLKLDAGKIRELCRGFEQAYPVNYNSPGQTVVAVKEENVEPVTQAFTQAGGRVKRLAVSGAFHSPFMADAARGLMEYMKGITVGEAKIPVYSNYTAKPYEGDYKALIKAQVENPVRWQTIIENMVSDFGVGAVIEVGVGKTLAGLVKRINKDIKAYKVENPADLEALDL